MQFSCATHPTSLQLEKRDGLLDMVLQKDVHIVEKVSHVLPLYVDKQNYSGFNCSAWPKRSLEQHRIKWMDWKHAKTQVE